MNGDNAPALQPIVKRHNEDMRWIVLYVIRFEAVTSVFLRVKKTLI
jgi:hypothetical protein